VNQEIEWLIVFKIISHELTQIFTKIGLKFVSIRVNSWKIFLQRLP
jgi:hypothetical protein